MKKSTAHTAHLQIAQAGSQAEFAKELSFRSTDDNIYSDFNDYIRNEFFSMQETGETIIFAVDKVVINDFIQKKEMSFEVFQNGMASELRLSWRTKTVKNIDCFGICAIQIFIAHQMRKDGDFSSKEYNPRLAKFLNIDTNALQRIYRESQNQLWCNLKKYCEENQFEITIPSPTSGKGCYVQYPFSQTLLNQEDLKQTPILFEKVGIKRTEYFPFDEFSKLIENADNSCCMNSHYYKVKERLIADFGTYEVLYQQIFNFFINNWDGSYIDYSDSNATQQDKSTVKKSISIMLDKNIESITVFDYDYTQIEKVAINEIDLFSYIRRNYKLYDNDFLIFEKDGLSDESEYVRKFETGKQYVLICKKYGTASNFISSLSRFNVFPNQTYDIFTLESLSKVSKHPFWSKFFLSQSRNYKIDGGLKLGYNIWMYRAGPIISLESGSEAWLNGAKIESSELDCSNLPVGVYKLKVENFPPEKFVIKDFTYTPQTTCSGWEISKREHYWKGNSVNFQISGLRHHFTNDISKPSVRMWIKSMKEMKDNSSTSNQVINSIRRSKYGL